MAYVTGTANSIADLLTAIQAACTANGWTLAGNVLYKGTCYVEIAVSSAQITIQGGTGIDGSNNLTGRADSKIGYLGAVINSVAFGWPVTYEVFINAAPDEVVAEVTYAVNAHQRIGWGQSSVSGLTGTGNWYSGIVTRSNSYSGFDTRGENGYSTLYPAMSLFGRFENDSMPHGVDHRLDATTWVEKSGVQDMLGAILRQPSQWNGEACLLPVTAYASRPSGFVSKVLELAHVRFVNIANLNDGQIITLGTDRWKIYPFWRRGTALAVSTGSWYAGHAFRYDGP